MKNLIGALVLASVALPAQAITIDLEGFTADGAEFNVFTVAAPADIGLIRSIEFSFVYDAGVSGSNISWGSELVVQVGHLPSDVFAQIGTQANSCDSFGVACEFDLMWDDVAGIYTASGSFALPTVDGMGIADASGDWEILIADSFDDTGIDGVFLEGSYITLSATPVPLPAAVWLFGSALLGLGAAARRRSAAS